MGFLPENYDQNYHNYLQVRREPHGVSCTATLSPLQNRLSPACIHIVLLPCCHFPHRRFQKHTRGKRQNDLEKHRQDDHTAYVWNNTPVFILQIVMLLIVKAPMYKQSPMIFFSSGIIIMCRSVLFSIDLTSSPFSWLIFLMLCLTAIFYPRRYPLIYTSSGCTRWCFCSLLWQLYFWTSQLPLR